MSRNKEGKVSASSIILIVIVCAVIVFSLLIGYYLRKEYRANENSVDNIRSAMNNDADEFAAIIGFSTESGEKTPEEILKSQTFKLKKIIITDNEGNILSKSPAAESIYTKDDIISIFEGGEYTGDITEDELLSVMKGGARGFYTVSRGFTEYISFAPFENGGMYLFYILNENETEDIKYETSDYISMTQTLTAAYIAVTAILIFLLFAYISAVLDLSSNKKIKRERILYSNISRVLSREYERIYYVNSKNNKFMLFMPSAPGKDLKNQREGVNFWIEERNEILKKITEDTVESAIEFFNRKNLTEKLKKGKKERIRVKMNAYGKEKYYNLRAYMTENGSDRFYVIAFENVDDTIRQNLTQLEEKDAALKRLEIYRKAMLHSMLAYIEINLTTGKITDGPFTKEEDRQNLTISQKVNFYAQDFDKIIEKFGNNLYKNEEERSEYIKNNKSESLRNMYENGTETYECNYDVKWLDGTAKNIRQYYYMSKSDQNGDVLAICVLYDVTAEKEKEREISSLTEALMKSRIRISTGQMQPHFLYNVLGSIREIIVDDPQYASDLICDFTTHLRACIKSLSNDNLIPFSKEIENIQAYVNIEKMRFGDRMKVEFDTKVDDFEVVPLSIQPLVENSIRHGIFHKKDGMGIVKISSFRQNGYIAIVVSDNGVGFDYEKLKKDVSENRSDSTGLKNLTLRLEKIMNARVFFESEIGVGTTATVLIPEKKEG